jgi:hypothetical protein
MKAVANKTVLREFSKRPAAFFAWLENDRVEQRRVGENKLRRKFNDLLEGVS